MYQTKHIFVIALLSILSLMPSQAAEPAPFPNFTPLKPGDVFFIAAPAVHRAVDILTCVVALLGFKPDNDRYVDQDIYDQSNGQAPCNLTKLIR